MGTYNYYDLTHTTATATTTTYDTYMYKLSNSDRVVKKVKPFRWKSDKNRI